VCIGVGGGVIICGEFIHNLVVACSKLGMRFGKFSMVFL
jgi:hypothetical protein